MDAVNFSFLWGLVKLNSFTCILRIPGEPSAQVDEAFWMGVDVEARTPRIADQGHAPFFCELDCESVGGGERDHNGYPHARRLLQHFRADAPGGEQDGWLESWLLKQDIAH